MYLNSTDTSRYQYKQTHYYKPLDEYSVNKHIAFLNS